jgi:hypothetical protein
MMLLLPFFVEDFFVNYFVPSLLVLPLLVSCDVVEVDHYGPSYYTHSHPQVEVETRYVNRQARMHGHRDMRSNAVVVNPRNPSNVTVHGHNEAPRNPANSTNAHGHNDVNRNAVNARPTIAPQSQPRSNVHGHNEEEINAPQISRANVHGHEN